LHVAVVVEPLRPVERDTGDVPAGGFQPFPGARVSRHQHRKSELLNHGLEPVQPRVYTGRNYYYEMN